MEKTDTDLSWEELKLLSSCLNLANGDWGLLDQAGDAVVRWRESKDWLGKLSQGTQWSQVSLTWKQQTQLWDLRRGNWVFSAESDNDSYHNLPANRVELSHWPRLIKILWSHWSRSLLILCSHWLNLTKGNFTCISLCCYGMISGFQGRKDSLL